MARYIKIGKIAAWCGIVVNAFILLAVWILWNGYRNAAWIPIITDALRFAALAANTLMIGGLLLKLFFEYKIKKLAR